MGYSPQGYKESKMTDQLIHTHIHTNIVHVDNVDIYHMYSIKYILYKLTPWTVAYQAPPSMGFSRQEYCSGLPFPSPGDLPDPGIEPGSPTL